MPISSLKKTNAMRQRSTWNSINFILWYFMESTLSFYTVISE